MCSSGEVEKTYSWDLHCKLIFKFWRSRLWKAWKRRESGGVVSITTWDNHSMGGSVLFFGGEKKKDMNTKNRRDDGISGKEVYLLKIVRLEGVRRIYKRAGTIWGEVVLVEITFSIGSCRVLLLVQGILLQAHSFLLLLSWKEVMNYVFMLRSLWELSLDFVILSIELNYLFHSFLSIWVFQRKKSESVNCRILTLFTLSINFWWLCMETFLETSLLMKYFE